MSRSLCWAVLVLALSAVGLTVARDGKDLPDRKPTAPPAEPTYFDVGRFLQEHDRDKDGRLSREELPPRLRHAFDKLDADKDGKLSREELLHGIAFLQPRRRPSDVVFVVIEMSDCDEGAAEEVQRMYDVLRKLDRNKDGKIDPDELAAMRRNIVEERVDALIGELDEDRDGKISRAEAKGEIRRNFDVLDRNKDGYVDRAELMQAAQAKPPAAPDKGGAEK
jgi:Ca2+-binding EF-hand superfamily protein